MHPIAVFLSALIIFFTSCGSPEQTTPLIPEDSTTALEPFKMGPLDSAVIYCWCFKNGESSCATFAAVKPAELCDSSHYLLSMTGSMHLSSFQKLINNATLQKNKWGARDARFVIKCFAKDSSFLLTYADYDDYTLWIDENRELKCNRPVLAWIMNEMGLSEITCKD